MTLNGSAEKLKLTATITQKTIELTTTDNVWFHKQLFFELVVAVQCSLIFFH